MIGLGTIKYYSRCNLFFRPVSTKCIYIYFFQNKFPSSGWNPPHGIRLECTCIVILNALGFIGFKVISTSGDHHEYVWTMERNLDMDTQSHT